MTVIYRPEKLLWTEADFETMGWHDATIHAVAFPLEDFEIAFDIDYIFKWIDPTAGQTHFRFWVSPATLVFRSIHGLHIDLDPGQELTMQDIDRADPLTPGSARHIGQDTEWQWRIRCNEGEISFRACGFTQYIRQSPRFGKHQTLSLEERGGCSFDRPCEWLNPNV